MVAGSTLDLLDTWADESQTAEVFACGTLCKLEFRFPKRDYLEYMMTSLQFR